MTLTERRATFSLAGIYALRMLGLFLILPVFSLYAEDQLSGATPMLTGLAIGAYGLSQAILQIPFGMLSDRFGRKPMIIIGLIIFAAGSAVAALSDSITGVIIGRSLQGAGAIAAVVMALAADLTRETQRTKAMATIGTTIGVSFALALIAGPLLNVWIGVPGIFWLTCVLALASVVLLQAGVPHVIKQPVQHVAQSLGVRFRKVLADGQLMRLNGGIMALHMILIASFVALPLALRDAGLPAAQHGYLYLPVLLLAIIAMVPFIVVGEKRHRLKQVFLGAIVLLASAELALLFAHASLWAIGVALFVFFTAFNVLEASLPSLVSKLAPPASKGAALGVYSTAQFLGAFLGGLGGGGLYGSYGLAGVFGFCAAVAGLWIVLAWGMKPRYLRDRILNVGALNSTQAEQLSVRLMQVPGVVEAAVIVEEGMAYLKIDSKVLDEKSLGEFLASGA
jgi:MFS family permease